MPKQTMVQQQNRMVSKQFQKVLRGSKKLTDALKEVDTSLTLMRLKRIHGNMFNADGIKSHKCFFVQTKIYRFGEKRPY